MQRTPVPASILVSGEDLAITPMLVDQLVFKKCLSNCSLLALTCSIKQHYF